MDRLSSRLAWRRGRRWLTLGLWTVAAMSLTRPLAGKEAQPAWPTVEHLDPGGGAFTFRAPEGWQVATVPGRKGATRVSGPEAVVWFLHLRTEVGLDSLHVSCMAEHLAGPMEAGPAGSAEYDFVSRPFASGISLDSAREIAYDTPIQGHTRWRQRNVTVVGGGESLCIIVHCPAKVWKKSRTLRSQLDGIVGSVAFRPQP